jgi:hypothetical protein
VCVFNWVASKSVGFVDKIEERQLSPFEHDGVRGQQRKQRGKDMESFETDGHWCADCAGDAGNAIDRRAREVSTPSCWRKPTSCCVRVIGMKSTTSSDT